MRCMAWRLRPAQCLTRHVAYIQCNNIVVRYTYMGGITLVYHYVTRISRTPM